MGVHSDQFTVSFDQLKHFMGFMQILLSLY